MLLRMFCGTSSSTWQVLSFVVVDTMPILCIHSELDTWCNHSCQLISVNFWEHYKACGERCKTLNYGEHMKTFDQRNHFPFVLDRQNLFISISLILQATLNCLHMFSILLLSLKMKSVAQLGDHGVMEHYTIMPNSWGVSTFGMSSYDLTTQVN